jgi:hypothetical protein
LLKFIKIPGIPGFSRIFRDLERLEVDNWDSLGHPTNPPQSKQPNSCKNPNIIEKYEPEIFIGVVSKFNFSVFFDFRDSENLLIAGIDTLLAGICPALLYFISSTLFLPIYAKNPNNYKRIT